jgi:hypothetical protein
MQQRQALLQRRLTGDAHVNTQSAGMHSDKNQHGVPFEALDQEGNSLAILAVERGAGERCDRIAIKFNPDEESSGISRHMRRARRQVTQGAQLRTSHAGCTAKLTQEGRPLKKKLDGGG